MKVISKLIAKRYASVCPTTLSVLTVQHVCLPLERHLHLLAAQCESSVRPHAPALFAAFQSEQDLYLITAFAPCGTLWDRLNSGSCNKRFSKQERTQPLPLPEDEVRWWVSQMVAAIAWVHAAGYVHRWVLLILTYDHLLKHRQGCEASKLLALPRLPSTTDRLWLRRPSTTSSQLR
jgi:serine/threonine protein kinase